MALVFVRVYVADRPITEGPTIWWARAGVEGAGALSGTVKTEFDNVVLAAEGVVEERRGCVRVDPVDPIQDARS
jgi:hypothetical protein